MVHAPAVMDEVVERDLNDSARRRFGAERRTQRTGEIDPVEAQDHVGGADGVGGLSDRCDHGGCADVQRMVGWECRPDLEISNHTCVERPCQCDAGIPSLDAPRGAPGEDQWVFRALQSCRGLLDDVSRCRHGGRGDEAGRLDGRKRFIERRFLHPGIEIDVDRSHRRGPRDPSCAQERLAGRRRRGGLIIPFDIAAHDRALIPRGVDPVDPGPPLDRVDRAGRADHDDRHSVAPCIENRHGRVEQPDIRVDGHGHWAPGHFGVTVRNRYCVLLVKTQQHLRADVAEMVDEAVVQAAIARARVKRDVRDVEGPQRFGRHVAAEPGCVGTGRHGTLDRGERIVGHRLRRGLFSLGRRLCHSATAPARAGTLVNGQMARRAICLGFTIPVGRGPNQDPCRNRASTLRPAYPSAGVRPALRWNARTASIVSRPTRPSVPSVSKPALVKRLCIS